jgi:hypothetical protein
MTNTAIEPARLDDFATAAGFSVKETDKATVSKLLASTREGVMRKADALPIDSPPALAFDPR